jgi:hypothetical protein
MILMGRPGTVDEITEAMLDPLIEPDCYVTGTELVINGRFAAF